MLMMLCNIVVYPREIYIDNVFENEIEILAPVCV